tara:strand:+ start:22 stop:408 length:387 start_codon:yes stop_codon:yes gene_type:complete
MALYPPPSSGGSSSSTSSGGGTSSAVATTAPYQDGTQINVNNTSSTNNVTCYTVPSGKKFIGIIQRNYYYEFSVNDEIMPTYLNGNYSGNNAFHSTPATKIHLVAGSVVKKVGAQSSHLRILGVESDA